MNVPGKPGVKNEVDAGWTPTDWQTYNLGDLVTKVGSGVTPKGGSDAYLSKGIPLVRSQNVLWGRLNLNDVAHISSEQHMRMKNSALKPLDVLLNITGASIGRCAVLPKNFRDGNVNQHVCIIRTKESLQPDFLSHYLISQFGQEQIYKLQAGGNREGLNYQQVRGFSIRTPPILEQKKIAAILTAVDDKLYVIARQITATKIIKQGLMQTIFSRGVGTQDVDGRWVSHAVFKDSELGEIPVTWDARPLMKLAQESRKRNSGSLDDNLLCGVLKSQGLMPMRERVKGASTERCRVVEPDAFAYNPMRINIGSIARNLSQRAVMVSPDYVVFASIPSLLSADYLDHFRKSDGWTRFVGQSGDGGVRIRIYFDHLSHLLVPTPPMLEQQRIVEILTEVDAKVNVLHDKQTHYQTLKRGLMQKLLTGEWRVKLDEESAAHGD